MYWYKDIKGDASIWVTLFNSAFPYDDTIIQEDGMLEIRIGDTSYVSGYCSRNINKNSYYKYVDKLESLMKRIYKKQSKILIAGDYNTKSAVWDGDKTDKEDRTLMGALVKNGITTIKVNKKYSFVRGNSNSYLGIVSVNNNLARLYKRTKIPQIFNLNLTEIEVIINFRRKTTIRRGLLINLTK